MQARMASGGLPAIRAAGPGTAIPARARGRLSVAAREARVSINPNRADGAWEDSMRSNRSYISPDLWTFIARITYSQIVAALETAQRFPAGFDDRDVAILQWIAAEGRHA